MSTETVRERTLMSDLAITLTAIGAFIAGVITAFVKGYTDYKRAMLQIEKIKHENSYIWKGLSRRGYFEAINTPHLEECSDGRLVISEAAREAYAPIVSILHKIYLDLKKSLGEEPNAEQLTKSIEMFPYSDADLSEITMQSWLLTNICPVLGMRDYGCVAIASIIAREGKKYETSKSGDQSGS